MEPRLLHQTKPLVYAALGIALVFCCTAFVNVRLLGALAG